MGDMSLAVILSVDHAHVVLSELGHGPGVGEGALHLELK